MAINKTVLAGAVFLATIWISSGAEAALVADRNGKTVYDTVKQKTWLANANLAATQKFGVSGINPDGSMSWDAAQRWIAAMNAANYLGSKHWSLPDTALPDNGCSQKPKSAAFGYDCTGSQMGDLLAARARPGGGVSDVLDHLAARLGAVSTLPRAALHVLVVGVFLARRTAGVARLGARLAREDGHRPMMRPDLRGCGGELGPIRAGAERLQVLLLALRDALGAVMGARLAFAHTVGARLGALVEMRGVSLVVFLARPRLQRGAAHVVALDVAYGELDWRLRGDPRVTVIERRNARSLAPGEIPYAPELITIDVSFIALEKVLPAAFGLAAARFDCLALVKPQFEVGRGMVGKGGVVRDPALRRSALASVADAASRLGASIQGFAASGLPGPKGNLETFIWLAEAGRPSMADVQEAIGDVEP